MTTEGAEDDLVRLLRDDVRRTLSVILPEAFDQTLREYKIKLTSEFNTIPRQPNPNPTYAQAAAAEVRQNAPQNEIQRFNEQNRWYMNNMYHKREDALFKRTRCEKLSAIYEDCQKLGYVPRGFRKDNYNLMSLDEYKQLHEHSMNRFVFECNILKSRIPMFQETIRRTDEEVKNFVNHLQGFKIETLNAIHTRWHGLFEMDQQRILKIWDKKLVDLKKIYENDRNAHTAKIHQKFPNFSVLAIPPPLVAQQ